MSDDLCEELIVEILKRLPAKSLIRFRSLSKSLRSCIDSPGFIRMHTARSPKSIIITHVIKYNYIAEPGHATFCTLHEGDQLPLCPIRRYAGITSLNFPSKNAIHVSSCNGILCLLDLKKGIISLWNPSIMRQLILPDCPLSSLSALGIGIGVGFDPITDDNKIVSIPVFGDGNGFVYAMKTRAWRPISSPMPLYSRVLSRACYLNGVLHWMVEHCFNDSKVCYIMTLDLGTHTFGMINLPKPNGETHKVPTIQGSLAVISNSRVSDDSWIWVMRDDASWSVIFKLKTNHVQAGVKKVLEPNNNGDLLLYINHEGIQVYNPKTGARSSLVKFNDVCSLFEMDMYVESLHLLHMGAACEPNQPSFLAA